MAGTPRGAGSPRRITRASRRRRRSRGRSPTRASSRSASSARPAAFVDAMPPTVQNAPLDGSTGKRSPCCARGAHRPRRARRPGRRRIVRALDVDRPDAPAAQIDDHAVADRAAGHAAPRSARDERRARVSPPSGRARRGRRRRRGTATARGMTRAMPAASEYTARASSSMRKTPRNSGGRIVIDVHRRQRTDIAAYPASPAEVSSLAANGAPMERDASEHDARAPAGASDFAREILPAVSRTFALSIRVLPGDARCRGARAYLLCRIADTHRGRADARRPKRRRRCSMSCSAASMTPRRADASRARRRSHAATRRTCGSRETPTSCSSLYRDAARAPRAATCATGCAR